MQGCLICRDSSTCNYCNEVYVIPRDDLVRLRELKQARIKN